jgi:hypothetical protein
MENPFASYTLEELRQTFDNLPKKRTIAPFSEGEKYKYLYSLCNNTMANLKDLLDYYLREGKPPCCIECGQVFIKYTRSRRAKTCSKECSYKASSKGNKITCMQRYGVGNAFNANGFDEKRKKTSLQKYGVSHPSCSKQARDRMTATNMERYGVANGMCSLEALKKKKEARKNWSDEKKLIVSSRARQTTLARYGVEFASQNPDVRAKVEATSMERYGVPCAFQTEEVKTKIAQTIQAKYGVLKVGHSKEVRERITNTCLETFGATCIFGSKLHRDQIKQNNCDKYGTEFPSQLKEVKAKTAATWEAKSEADVEEITTSRRKTCQERYGVDNPTQDPIIFGRQQARMRKKIYKIRLAGTEVSLSGYEPRAIQYLLTQEHLQEDDLAVKHSQGLPHIPYTFKGKVSVYHPDIYVKSQNRIIEVKSSYTYEADLEKNLAKSRATKALDYKFNFYIFNKDSSITTPTII